MLYIIFLRNPYGDVINIASPPFLHFTLCVFHRTEEETRTPFHTIRKTCKASHVRLSRQFVDPKCVHKPTCRTVSWAPVEWLSRSSSTDASAVWNRSCFDGLRPCITLLPFLKSAQTYLLLSFSRIHKAGWSLLVALWSWRANTTM